MEAEVNSPMLARRATQRDVARAAGVSQASVSLVLGNAEAAGVPAATRARIVQAAAALGYVPNRAAQSLRTARTRTLACVVPDITNPFYPGLVRGLQLAANDAGYDVMILDTDGTPEREQRAIDQLRRGRVDGVLATFFHARAADLAALLQDRVAVARIENRHRRPGPLPIDNIYVDNAAAAAEMTRLLIDRGHDRVAMIAGSAGPAAERVRGYGMAMDKAGLPPMIIQDAEFTAQAGRRCMARLLGAVPRPTAVFGANDLLAIGAMAEIRDAGLDVPGDVAVAGFDDIPAAALVMPGLTTVRQPEQAMGEAAGAVLLARLAHSGPQGPGISRKLPYEIMLRGSV